MKTLICTFLSNGKKVKKTIILSNDLSTLSNSKMNDGTDLFEDDESETWSIFIETSESPNYELVFRYDNELGEKTLIPVKAITWEGTNNDAITDVQKLALKIR